MPVSSPIFRHLFVCFVLLGSGVMSPGGVTPFTDRGKADFDTALQILNRYGTWSKIDGKWAYTPLDHPAPYTNGRWIYTEFGWYWKGNLPHSWATEHYGYWKRDGNKIWSWYPGPYWLPETVEIRATPTHIGWRSAEVDRDGDFMESPADRYAKTDEWTFVTLAQFAGPITPGIIAQPKVAENLLDDSTECRHTYWTYRAIDRPGPHPADFLTLCRDGGMFAPKTLQDQLAAQPPPPSPFPPGLSPSILATQARVAAMTGTNAPTLLGADPDGAVDQRRVKYWLTMSLPTYWTRPPADARAEEIYLYRPDFYQDEDGIARRITLWFNPMARTSLKDVLAGSNLGGKPDTTPGAAATPAMPATPAAPRAHDPFRSPFDDPYQPGSSPRPSHASSKAPVAPSGTNTELAPIPLPLINTNAAPVNPR